LIPAARTTPNKIIRADEERFSRDIEESAYFESEDDDNDSEDSAPLSPSTSPSKSLHPMLLRPKPSVQTLNSAPSPHNANSTSSKSALVGDPDEEFGPGVSLGSEMASIFGEETTKPQKGILPGTYWFDGIGYCSNPKRVCVGAEIYGQGDPIALESPSPNSKKRSRDEMEEPSTNDDSSSTSGATSESPGETSAPPAKRLKAEEESSKSPTNGKQETKPGVA